ncbi:MAG: SH3 domain-containing protein [Bryobacteraceae bacterium]
MPLKIKSGTVHSITNWLRARTVFECAVPVFVCLLVLMAAGCRPGPGRAPVIGEVFVGPATLNLREEISLRSKTVATVKHGDRLEILQRRRRFLLVRAPHGQEGWTDNRQVLSPAQMAALRQLSDRAEKLASHGRATVFDVLNMHTEAHRLSPSFYQLKEGDFVDVVGHRLTPRTGTRPPGEELQKPPAPPRRTGKPTAPRRKPSGKLPPPPMPTPPPPPANWIELSKTHLPPAKPAPETEQETKPASAVAMEDWSLVRDKGGRAGWVLTRNLRMAIPDEVAQYAEGHRITSYFSLGEVRDGDAVKKNWLWTTIVKGGERYEFDSFRVFVWSLRRHRYETAYIERNVTGYFPVEVHKVTVASRKGSYDTPGFSVIIDNENGQPEKRTYAFQGYRVAMVSKTPYKPEPEEMVVPSASEMFGPEQAPQQKGFFTRVGDFFSGLWHRIRGK